MLDNNILNSNNITGCKNIKIKKRGDSKKKEVDAKDQLEHLQQCSESMWNPKSGWRRVTGILKKTPSSPFELYPLGVLYIVGKQHLEEGGTFPKVTIAFISMNLIFFFSLYLISIIKGEKVSTVLSESKTTLRGIFFPALYFLNHSFLSHSGLDLDRWIGSLVIQILILLLLTFILNKEDQDQDRKDK